MEPAPNAAPARLHQDPRLFAESSQQSCSRRAGEGAHGSVGRACGATRAVTDFLSPVCVPGDHPAKPVLSPAHGSLTLGFFLGRPRALRSTLKATSSAPQNPPGSPCGSQTSAAGVDSAGARTDLCPLRRQGGEPPLEALRLPTTASARRAFANPATPTESTRSAPTPACCVRCIRQPLPLTGRPGGLARGEML